ncbi:MAG TPA: type II toxin-antitoxin system VapC family toxin [Thermoguttaceae bacterium]|nr:type II toxin-antitoxin system VapC family toxin [Thermoguttaceae bacterium]
MAKTVYIESTVPNAYASERQDAASVYRRDITRRWWMLQAALYELCTSEATLAELKAGSYAGQQQAVQLVASLPLIEITDEVYAIADAYVRHQLMPKPAVGDALHLALASLNELDYLLTWNVRHLANPNKLEHLTVVNRRLGLLSPTIISPEQLWAENLS